MAEKIIKTEFDVEKIRGDFPMLSVMVNNKPLKYLDNAATTHKPFSVIERVRKFDAEEYATIHRGTYKLGEKATMLYNEMRTKVASFIGAPEPRSIIFTSGATQSINLAAYSFGRRYINEGDEIIISHIEHHANIVPWQVLCEERKAILKVIPVNDNGELIMEKYEQLLSEKTRLVAITHISNALGTVNPVREIVKKAHDVGARVLIDGAQSIPHMKVNVKEMNCDFLAFSGHKIYGPTGIGVLYGKPEILESMPPYVTGGDMINTVTFERTTYVKPPSKFEAGTPPISQVIGLGAAIDYINSIGIDRIQNYEKELLIYGEKVLQDIDGLRIIGTAKNKASIISFSLENVHPHDVATILDEDGIAVRGGHHCAQPTMKRFGVPATTRASFAFYNKPDELDALARGIKRVLEIFS